MFSIIPDSELIIKSLDENLNLTSFFCNNSELNEFLKDDALRYQDYLISRTSLCFWKNELVGYFTLTTATIQVKDVINKDDYKNKYRYFPAMKIARLAVDSRFEKRGIGKHMLFAAIGKVWSIRESVACRYILVDSKIDSIGFYEKNGFRKIENQNKKDFIPLYFDLKAVIKVNAEIKISATVKIEDVKDCNKIKNDN